MSDMSNLTCPNCGSKSVRRDGEPASSRFAAETLIAPFVCRCGHKFLQSVPSLDDFLSLPNRFEQPLEPEEPPTPASVLRRRPRRNKIGKPIAAD